jgi:hypothetical protein
MVDKSHMSRAASLSSLMNFDESWKDVFDLCEKSFTVENRNFNIRKSGQVDREGLYRNSFGGTFSANVHYDDNEFKITHFFGSLDMNPFLNVNKGGKH